MTPNLFAFVHLLAQATGDPAADAASLLERVNAWLQSVSQTVIVSIFVAGVLLAMAGQVLGIKLLPGANSTMGKVIGTCLLGAVAIGYGPSYLAGLL